MKGKTVVITGGTSGIGEIAAERLAQMGARIVLIARDKSRGEGTLAQLHERAPGLGHAVHYADLARVTANCLHPGFVATRFGDQSGGVISRFVGLAKLFAISPEKGAETIIYLASSAAVTETTGVYFYQRLPIIEYFLAVTSLCAKHCIMRANRKKGPPP
jgi:NAD(P)-dependent dehydrogenase (short-subunit alcohol dehydrogenase family)